MNVIDGDTIRADIDLGFGVWLVNQPIRLAGIDAPELRGETREAGIVSKNALHALVMSAPSLILQTRKTPSGQFDKYGRYLGTLFTDKLVNVNEYMISNGYAVPLKY